MWVLTKLSAPGWERKYVLRGAAVESLRKCICELCIQEVADRADAAELLGTPCGCEYMLEDESEG